MSRATKTPSKESKETRLTWADMCALPALPVGTIFPQICMCIYMYIIQISNLETCSFYKLQASNARLFSVLPTFSSIMSCTYEGMLSESFVFEYNVTPAL